MVYEDRGGGGCVCGGEGGVIAPAEGLWHAKQCLSVFNCGLSHLNAAAGDKEQMKEEGMLIMSSSCATCVCLNKSSVCAWKALCHLYKGQKPPLPV